MFTLTLVTPERKILTGAEITEAFVPGYVGELNILPGHAPLMTILQTGILRYKLQGEEKLYHVAVSSGYCQVNPEGINVLAETAEMPEDIDLDRAKNAYAESSKRLQAADIGVDLMEKYRRKMSRSVVRQEVAEKLKN